MYINYTQTFLGSINTNSAHLKSFRIRLKLKINELSREFEYNLSVNSACSISTLIMAYSKLALN